MFAMSIIGRRGIHFLHKLNAENVPGALIEHGQSRLIDASLTLIRESAKLRGELVRALGGAVASTSLLGVPLGHNSSFLQGPAFAPPRIREAIWCGSTNSTTEEGKELRDPRVLTDVGDIPVQEIRDCGVEDDRLMNVISESVKLVMEQAYDYISPVMHFSVLVEIKCSASLITLRPALPFDYGKTFHIEIHMGTLHIILKSKLRVVYCTVMHYFENVKENEKLVAISGQLKCSDVFSYFESSINLADIWLNFILENYPGYVLVCAICFLKASQILRVNVVLSWLRLFIPMNICIHRLPFGSFWKHLIIVAMPFQDPLRPLVLGGDHSISYPVVRAVSEKLGGPVDILHLDAHPDIYDAFEGNVYSHASSFARIMEGGYARRLLQVGIRSINIEGREQGKRFGVEQYEMRTFSRDRHFLENLKLGEGVKGVYISIDVDCLDPAFAPGVSHIEPGGLSFRDVLNILHNLQGDIVAADVVEFNPQRDTVDGMTAMVAAKLA
ncbi:arginase [Prunus dulcis]|uniref:arginase n=1 Tax=Prunus dulcis TaxID=3755 RepID=A0A4Y1QZZ4_PRUDU|nr:arginase [Prunus dulcis]